MTQSIFTNLGDGYVLAVEDSLVQAKRLEFFFKKYSIQYKIFSNAEEAYNEAIISAPILIISDIMMPGMNGYDFCKAIKSDSNLSDTPVILLTSLQDSDDIIKGLQSNADNFIPKPYSDINLLGRINHLLRNKTVGKATNNNDNIEINFHDNNYIITSSKKQVVELLLSVYETAFQYNEELIATKNKLEKSNEEILTANRDMESFSSIVSFDLKSPLSTIIGFIDVILNNPDSKIDEDERGYLKLVLKSSLEMSQFIKDLLIFSQSCTVEILPDNINLSEIAQEVINSLILNYEDKSYNVTIDPDLKAQADPKMVRIMLDNLLGNALKYSSKQENPVIIVGRKDYYGNDLFFVKDNGVGFDMSKADSLFHPFFRYHSGSEFSGTGIGLSTVKRIVEKHGGHIWAESEVGKGSTFYFTLK